DVESSVKIFFEQHRTIKGTHMKAVYEAANEGERTEERMKHLHEIAKEYGNDRFSAERWVEIVKKDARWQNLPDAAFLAKLWYHRRCVATFWRRGAYTIDGVPVSGPAALSLCK